MKVALTSGSDGAVGGKPWTWRDYWVKSCLADAFAASEEGELAYDAENHVHIWGFSPYCIDPLPNNFLWVVSHPEALLKVLPKVKSNFTHVFCASKIFTELLVGLDVSTTYLPVPPPIRGPWTSPWCLDMELHDPDWEIAFVGNADPAKDRPSLYPLFRRFRSIVWGGGWKLVENGNGRLSRHGGGYYPFKGVPSVWDSAKIVPYTHHKDMRKYGFIADSALDAMVNSRALVISDENPGWHHLGLDSVPTFKDSEDLCRMAELWLLDEDDRRGRIRHIKRSWKKQLENLTYAQTAVKMMEVMKQCQS